MTETKTSLFKKGSRCRICTGCGRCFGERQVNTVCEFAFPTPGWETGSEQENFLKEECLVAVDIGTTTIAMQLREMVSGKVLSTYTCKNPQSVYGADVLSRIEAASEPKAKQNMRDRILAVLQNGLTQFDKERAKIVGMAIAANTTMIHLLMGYDVTQLGRHPFTPETISEIRTNLCGVETVILPGVSAFVGADIVGGIYALSMQEREEITLLVDLGTNGEMVLGNKKRMLATSTAAGPAFEGDGECFGTDMMRLVAQLLHDGLLDRTGLLEEACFKDGVMIGGVHITQPYIRQLQMAKSAICTGIQILCEKYGLQTMEVIDKVFLAGGMGYYLDVEAAVAIGLLPKQLEKKTIAVGNAALQGAFMYGREVFDKKLPLHGLQEKNAEHQMTELKIEEFNLATEPAFADAYISGMALTPCI